MNIAIFTISNIAIPYCENLFEHCDKYKKDPHESDKGVVVLLSDPETDQYIQEVSHLSS